MSSADRLLHSKLAADFRSRRRNNWVYMRFPRFIGERVEVEDQTALRVQTCQHLHAPGEAADEAELDTHHWKQCSHCLVRIKRDDDAGGLVVDVTDGCPLR